MLNNFRFHTFRVSAFLILLFYTVTFIFFSPHKSHSTNLIPSSFSELAETYAPTVVNIYSTQNVQSKSLPYNYFFENEQLPDLFKHFFDLPKSQERQLPSQKRTSLGSGVITSADGYIITNNHVVENADVINVRLSNYKEYEAKIIGRDKKTDLALIKIEPKEKLPFAEFGDSDELKVGEWVMAIGNPFGFDSTVTAGIVSGKGRTLGDGPYQNFIQTDASINPGNSGGPLFNLKGELMGINTAIYSRSGGNIGLGFAIPANMAKSIFTQLKGSGKVSRGMLGVIIQPVTPELAKQFHLERPIGALVAQVMPDSPSEKAKIKPGDIILKFNNKEILQMKMLPALVAQTPVGTKSKVEIFRNGKKKTIKVVIEELPEKGKIAKPEQSKDTLNEKIGLSLQELTPEIAKQLELKDETGLLVTEVIPGGLADKAGLKRGSIILEAGSGQIRQEVSTLEEFATIIDRAEGSNILLLVKQGIQVKFLLLKVK